MVTRITLTHAQRQLLAPLFTEVRASNAVGESCAIMAQVLPDGMILKAVKGDALEALGKALGADLSRHQRSVKPS